VRAMVQRLSIILVLASLSSLASGAGSPPAQPLSPAAIDATVARAMRAFQVPGMAVGIVKDGKLLYAKGYGVREVGKPGRVDADTLFQIGSNTKAFTAAALAILVDEGKIHWDDRVIDYLPQFRMYDPYVTREFTIRDLLTHRSGLGKGAGDLMFFPATDFSREDIIHGLRYLKPASGFRSEYAYDNLLYMVAGQIIPAVTGKSWEDFVTERILDPLQMRPCAPSYGRISDRSDVAAPHVVIKGELKAVPVVNMDVIGPAGTINCSINGMAKWLETQLAAGKTPTGQPLFSPERSEEMWTMNSVFSLDPLLASMYRTHFNGYALGWEVQDVLGYKRVAHTGGVLGSVTWVTMIPELKLGVLVLTNQESDAAMTAVGNQILDAYLSAPRRDWVDTALAYEAGRDAAAKTAEDAAANVASSAQPPSLPLDAYAGTYRDPWRGAATVRLEGGKLILQISRTQSLEGPLTPYSGNLFIVHWNDRSLNADAFVRFEQGFDTKVTQMTLHAVSPSTDFSFDFQDLHFSRADNSP
jgi:CubicO group peptidase (beta-lactamase class C family)